jgi:hypothetical protein
VDRNLAAAASSFWISFAGRGSASGDGLATWQPCRPGSLDFMVLADRPEVRSVAMHRVNANQ